MLRREGLFSFRLTEWRRLCNAKASGAQSKKRGRKSTRNSLAEEDRQLKVKVAPGEETSPG
jgi:hypothetical protein